MTKNVRKLLAAAALLLTQTGLRAQAQTVLLDPGFGTNGRVTTAFSTPPNDYAATVLLQPDGKLVAVGTANNGPALARYSSSGVLDPSFGTGGKVTAYTLPPSNLGCVGQWTPTTATEGTTALLQPDGKIVVGGSIGNYNFPGAGANWYVCRYLADGTFDTSFAPFASCGGTIAGRVKKVLRQSTGQIVVVGYNAGVGGCTNGSAQTPRLMRLQPNGTLDTSFGSGGSQDIGASRLQIQDAYVDANDRITTLGYREVCSTTGNFIAGYKTQLHRFLANGQPDTSFGTNGEVNVSLSAGYTMGGALLPQAGGQLLVAGLDTKSFLLRLLANGTLDPTFGTNGVVSQANMSFSVQRLLQQADGKFLLLANGRLARLLADGQQDTSFGLNGILQLFLSPASDLLLQPNGQSVVAGGTAAGFTLERYEPNPNCTQVDAGVDVSGCSGAVVQLGNPYISNPAFSYNWTVSPAIAGFSSTSSRLSVTLPAVTTTTVYTFTLTATASGSTACVPTDLMQATVTPLPAVPQVQATPNTINLGQPVALQVTNALPGQVYTWSGPGLQATTGTSVTATPPAGTISTALYTVRVSSNGCSQQATVPVGVRKPGSPAWAWARQVSPNVQTTAGSVVTDASGNAYLVGAYQGTPTLGGSIQLPAPAGGYGLYLAKYTAQGALAWARPVASSTGALAVSNLEMGPQGDLYLGGEFSGSLTLGTAVLTGSTGLFVAQLDVAGAVHWAVGTQAPAIPVGAYYERSIGQLTTDAQGNVYATGPCINSLSWGSYAVPAGDGYVVKISATGTVVWALSIDSRQDSSQDIYARGIAVDSQSNVYVLGKANKPFLFGTTTTTAPAYNSFLAKYSSTGAAQWISAITTVGAVSRGAKLAIGPADQVFLGISTVATTVSFDAPAGTAAARLSLARSSTKTDTYYGESYLACYGPQGTPVWAQRVGTCLANGWNELTSLRFANNSLYVLGYFGKTVNFDTVTLTDPSVYQSLFVARFGVTGAPGQWATNRV